MPRAAHVVLDSPLGYAVSIRAGRHTVLADEPHSRGGTDTGPAPYELFLSVLVACTAITLRMYADRKGWKLGPIKVDAELHKEDDDVERIDRVVSFGEVLTAEQQTRIAEIAEKTPVTKTIKRGVPIQTRFA